MSKDKYDEQDLQRDIWEYLCYHGGFGWINGIFKGKNQHGRFISTSGGFQGGKGAPDIWYMDAKGVWHAIEVKMPKKGKVNASQVAAQEEAKRWGGEIVIMKSIEDADKYLKKWGVRSGS